MGDMGGALTKRQRHLAVLDVGTSKICCLIAKPVPMPARRARAGDKAPFEVLGIGHHRAEGLKGGVVVHMDSAEHSIRAAIDEAERMAGVHVDAVRLAVTCGRLKSDRFTVGVTLSGAGVSTEDVGRAMAAGRQYAARDNRLVMHAFATGFGLDGNRGIKNPIGMFGQRLGVDIHAVTADHAPLRNLRLCVERCHVSVAALIAAPYASGLAVATPDEMKLGVTCIDLGAGATTMAVFSDGHFVFADGIATGSNHVTTDIARGLSTPIEQAERMKTLYGSAFATQSDEREIITYPSVGEEELASLNQISKAQLAMLVRPRIEQILDLVRQRLAASGLDKAVSERVVLTGGASALTGIAEVAALIIGKSVRVGRPKALLGLSDEASAPAFAAAIGTLLEVGRSDAAVSPASDARMLATGTGYFARMGQWLKESF